MPPMHIIMIKITWCHLNQLWPLQCSISRPRLLLWPLSGKQKDFIFTTLTSPQGYSRSIIINANHNDFHHMGISLRKQAESEKIFHKACVTSGTTSNLYYQGWGFTSQVQLKTSFNSLVTIFFIILNFT